MIIIVEDAIARLGIEDTSKNKTELEGKIKAYETSIINATNNKFLDINIRYCGEVRFEGNKAYGPFKAKLFNINDVIDIDESLLNKGIYRVTEIDDNSITADRLFKDYEGNALVTKKDYPADIVEGIFNMLYYDYKMKDKLGVKSETVSRYSVTYYDVNSTESIEGFPSTIMNFINKYKRLRW